jgi:signal transduction histidine kinase
VTAIAHHGERTWIGGQRGVGYIDKDQFHTLRLPDNGLFNNIYAILPVPVRDGQGEDLWIHSKSGIFQLTVAELRRAAADKTHQIRYRSYDLMGGLANDPYQVLPLPTAVRTTDGRLWFSTSGGVAWIDPEQPHSEIAGPTVIIESVNVDGARISTAAPATLHADARRIVLDYTALSLSAPERLNFSYRLDGYDKAWQDAGRQRQAVYTGLGAGSYTFRVLAHNKDGLPSTKEATFSFQVPLPFYRQPLFIALAAVFLSGSLWMVYRINIRRAQERMRERLEERHSERERIARELHDTLLQGVNGLILRFQAAADSLPAGDPARASLEQTLDRADQVLIEGRDRVRNLRSAQIDVSDLCDALRSLGAERAQYGNTAFTVAIAGSPATLRWVVRDEAYRIAHEAIVNAFAHAGAKRIDVLIEYAAHKFQLKISDDGCGIGAAYLTSEGRPDHWGLRGMHERAKKIGALLRVRSDASHGTEIALSVPARLAYRRRPPRFNWLRHINNKGIAT